LNQQVKVEIKTMVKLGKKKKKKEKKGKKVREREKDKYIYIKKSYLLHMQKKRSKMKKRNIKINTASNRKKNTLSLFFIENKPLCNKREK
jgi:hypothetical protein